MRSDSYHKSVEITRRELEACLLNIFPKHICSNFGVFFCLTIQKILYSINLDPHMLSLTPA